MTSSEEKKKRKQERAEKLRLKQEAALKRAHDQEKKDEKEKSETKQKEDIPEEMSSKGYKLSTDELSSGQFSTIFRAKLKDEDIVARVIEKDGKEESFLKKLIPRFVRILRILDERHPNIVSTLDVFETSKKVIILMRPTTGGTLYDFIDKQTNPTEESLCQKWSQQLISAVCYLHINGIAHRDLRSERILLDEKQTLKVSGFTFSRLWMNVQKNTKELSNTCVGTGPYCAPETLTGESYDPRTADVWAFGVIVFFIWNKRYPFDYNMTHKLLTQHKSNEWMNRIRKESNDSLKEFFRKTFDINHNQRQTIVELLKDKWIDSKIQVILDESLKALDLSSNGKTDTKKETNTKTKVENKEKGQSLKSTDESQKSNKEISKTNNGSKGMDKNQMENKETNKEITKVENETKNEQKVDKNISNENKKETKTEKNTNKENDSKEDTEDSDDMPDAITEDNVDDEIEKTEETVQSSRTEEKKIKIEEKPNQMKTNSSVNTKREATDPNILRPDILEEIKKEFLSLK